MIASMMRKGMLGDGSTLNVDFTSMTNGGQLANAGFTFTNATTTARTYINSSGLVATATTNEPRFDYTGGTARGLLIEAAATNLLSYSEDFSNAAWQKASTNGSMTLTGTAPDGTATSRLLEENTTVYAKHSLDRTSAITISSNNVYTLSVWLKEPTSNSRRYAHIQLADGQATAARYTIVADLQTGTISASGANNGTAGAPTGTAHSINAYPGGWYRVTISMNHVGSPSYPAIMLGDTATLFGGNNQPFYSATTPYKGLIVWGAQLEAGSGASSYIPTGASQVQRLRDEVVLSSLPGIAFNQSAGTIYSQLEIVEKLRGSFVPYGSFDTSGGGRCWWWLRHNHDASVGQRILGTAFNSGGSTAITSSNYTHSSGVFKFATSLDPVAGRMVYVIAGGSAQVTNASGFTLATAAQMSLNKNMDVAATDLGSMWVRSIKYWPTALPDATLQSMTT